MNRAEKRRQRKSAKKALKSKARSKLGGSQLERQQQLTTQIALDLAMQHHNAGLLPKAESIYQQILQTDPQHPIALHLLGMIALQMGKNDVALDLITKALDVKPSNADAYDAQGNALMNLGRLDEAIASYNKALAIEPDYADVHNNLGIALMNTGRLNEAIISYNKALAIKPDYAEAHNNLGIALWGLGKQMMLSPAITMPSPSSPITPRRTITLVMCSMNWRNRRMPSSVTDVQFSSILRTTCSGTVSQRL